MSIIPTALAATLALQAPASLGDIAFSVAVDQIAMRRAGVLDSVRPEMKPVTVPAEVRTEIDRDLDPVDDPQYTVHSFEAADGTFSITFVRYAGCDMADAYVLVDEVMLKTADVRHEPFRLFRSQDLARAS